MLIKQTIRGQASQLELSSPLPVGCGAQLGDVLGHVGVLHQEQSLGQAEHLHSVALDLLDQPLDLGDARAAGRRHAGVVQAQAGDNLAEQRVVQLSAPVKLGLNSSDMNECTTKFTIYGNGAFSLLGSAFTLQILLNIF